MIPVYPTSRLADRIKVIERLIRLIEDDHIKDMSNKEVTQDIKPMLPLLKDVLATLNLLMHGD